MADAAPGQLEFVTFDIVALEYNVIPHFRLIWNIDDDENVIFTFQCHPEVKTKMAANIQHKIIIFRPATIFKYFILK